MSFPIDPLLADAVASLRGASRLVLRAPPGAGKTTRVPAALLDAGLAGDKQVIVLEPRRIAARAAADFVAKMRGGRVGGEVGYRVRFEQRGDTRTRLWFVTEGVLGRQLGRDPFLEDVGVVVLDEFHERHLPADVALGVVCELQETVRPDLKLVIMSATLETEALVSYLGGCPALTSEGRSFPVEISYAAEPDDRPLSARVAGALRGVLDGGGVGDVLVFLPGAAEIRRCAAAIAPYARQHDLLVVPLHGELPLDAQELALRRALRRKVILSTNVAETALTVEGVSVVIDSGLARTAHVDPRHGINTLRVAPISRAAADQRAGRAGRTARGRCVRLWTRAEHEHRLERETPEVRRLDLAATVLELRAWGQRDPAAFRWLDPPREGALRHAEALLRRLGAIDVTSGDLTETGRRMLAMPVEPRIARVLIEAERRGCAARAALLAALAAEKDIAQEGRMALGERDAALGSGASDLLDRLERFERAQQCGLTAAACAAEGLDVRAAHGVERARRHIERVLAAARSREDGDEEALLRCVLAGFPDRVARRRAPGSPRGVMVGGRGVVLAAQSVVREAELFVAVDLDAGAGRERSEALVRIASAVRRQWLAEMFPAAVRPTRELVFDEQRERVLARTRLEFHDLVLEERIEPEVDRTEAGAVLGAAARRDPQRALGLGEKEAVLLERLEFLRESMPELAVPELPRLLGELAEELSHGRASFAELRGSDIAGVLRAHLPRAVRQVLEREAPERYVLPSGRSVAVRYAAGKPPRVAARIQELFGLTATPRLGGGRVALVVELLAPSGRPVQITDDLAGFWRSTYHEVRKQLRGRYPKHAWPEDPLHAAPAARPRRRS